MFSGSVRQNILFGEPFLRERYSRVVKVCALKRDFQLLPYADKTIVGERGVSLSGGQRARTNLARYWLHILHVIHSWGKCSLDGTHGWSCNVQDMVPKKEFL